MKVGDMVQYVKHATWENGGLGVITDINPGTQVGENLEGIIQITWIDDIEEVGWNEAIRDWAQWYDVFDFEEDIQMFAETA